MAGKLIVDTIDTDNAFITLNVQQSQIATMNVSGIYSNTGVKMIGANGTVSNTAITGLVTASQIANVANTQLTGTITGSQISSNTLSNTVFQTGSVENYMNAQGLGFGMRNRIINGAAVIAQRGTTFSGLSDDGGQYTLDRWKWAENGTFTGVQTVTQDTSAPAGFSYSLKVQTTTAVAVATSLSCRVEQFIEGFNWADMGYGTANAKTTTLSFWVRSSLTGTFGGAFRNSADDRSYPFSYTISVADTWEQKSITIAGDTSGTWIGATNGTGLRVTFSLGAGTALSGTAGAWVAAGTQSVTGAVSVVGTLNATWYVTGVQLEKGSTATSFDYRPYGTELQLCQRYFYRLVNASASTGYVPNITGVRYTANEVYLGITCPAPLRTTPSISKSGTMYIYSGGTNITLGGVVAVTSNYNSYTSCPNVRVTATSITSNTGWICEFDINAYFDISAEL